MDTVLEHRNTIRHAIFLSSLTVGEKNHSQCSSRVSQQITMHLSHLGGAPGPFSVECTKQEPALNTSSWGQRQPVSFRDHSPYLLCLRCGSPSLQQLATPFSTTAITVLVTVLTKHLVLGQQHWSEPDRKHWGCWLPATTLSKKQSVYLTLFLIFCHCIFLHIQ